ncbi:MAG: hypothetical protein JWN04_587, partial [Myxococcaceae bacterium]|nr:hypothetical protein [Myxococcaceae bacterium]
MSRAAVAARSMLAAMRELGAEVEASRLEREFAVLDWDLTAAHLAALSTALQRATLASPKVMGEEEEPSKPASLAESLASSRPAPPVPLPALAAPPAELALFEDFSPWVSTFPERWSLVRAVRG